MNAEEATTTTTTTTTNNNNNNNNKKNNKKKEEQQQQQQEEQEGIEGKLAEFWSSYDITFPKVHHKLISTVSFCSQTLDWNTES